MYGYIYKTTYLKTNKIYIGQHKANTFDANYYGSGKIIKGLLKKYPLTDFTCEIICECESAEELNEKEIFWIKELNALDKSIGYNIATGGAFGDSGYHLGMLGKHQSDKQKQAASKACSYKRSKEVRDKMAKSKIGNTNGHGNLGHEGTFKGKHHTEETKNVLAEKGAIAAKKFHDNLTVDEKATWSDNISKSKKGAICITDGKKNYFIQPDKWPEYEAKGYFKMSYQVYNRMNK